MGAMANDLTPAYIGWEEVVVTNEKRRREVHYYLKRGGERDLVVVGKEKGAKETSYRYAAKGKQLLLSFVNQDRSWLKLRCRREVVDWLNSVISGEHQNGSHGHVGDMLDSQLGAQVVKMDEHRSDFTWLGSPWACRKRRRHYLSFCRNGAVISAHDFVYVLAEENKRLIAYLDDMYEDSQGNKMVVVRWFHKLDEVGFILPHNYNDREIFFSLCLQDLSIECIDGLATVLSPEHYEKFFDEATRMGLVPFMCCRQFDNDDVNLFDITRVKGYWNQEILRNKFSSVELSAYHWRSKGSSGDASGIGVRPSKRIRWSKDCDLKSHDDKQNSGTSLGTSGCSPLESKVVKIGSLKGPTNESSPSQGNTTPPTSFQVLNIGSHAEVLSQDSGIRGCWFRALIIKKHKDNVKVRYVDLKDALDDSKSLEEWILPSRIAACDASGIRLPGRTMTRPQPLSDRSRVSGSVNVGCIVDAWWNDGWWEGIVVSVESEGRIKVYFPGEKRELQFSLGDLRHSKEWLDNKWRDLKEKPDFVSSLYGAKRTCDSEKDGAGIDDRNLDALNSGHLSRKVIKIVNNMRKSDKKVTRDLAKDSSLAQLRWKSTGKRQRRSSSHSPVHRVHFGTNSNEARLRTFEKFLVNSSKKFDQDNCKFASDSHFSSQVVPPVTNLVMSSHRVARRSMAMVRWRKKDGTLAKGSCPPRTTLASIESLPIPLVQEVVFLADFRCARCQKRVAEIMSKMNGETQSVVVSVLEKKVTLTCTYSDADQLSRHRWPWLRSSPILRLFRSSCIQTAY